MARNPFRAIGRGVTWPVRAAKRKTEMEIVRGIARHVLGALGGYLVGQGVLDGGQAEQLIGALLTLVSIAASVYQKKRTGV